MKPHDPEYDRIDAEVTRDKARSSRASVLLGRIYDAQAEELDPQKRRDLEALEFAVGLHCFFSRDVTAEGAQDIAARLQKIVGVAE